MGRHGGFPPPPLALAALLLVAVVSGCCEDCGCADPNSSLSDPERRLIGIWEVASYLMNDEPQEGLIGTLMALEDGGLGYMTDPAMTHFDTFTWAALDSTIFIEERSVGLATGFNDVLSGDPPCTWAEVTFIGPVVRYEAIRLPWGEPAE